MDKDDSVNVAISCWAEVQFQQVITMRKKDFDKLNDIIENSASTFEYDKKVLKLIDTGAAKIIDFDCLDEFSQVKENG